MSAGKNAQIRSLRIQNKTLTSFLVEVSCFISKSSY